MKYLKSLYSLILMTILAMIGCQEDDPSLGPIVTPTNIVVSSSVVGQDIDNPFGDGSGVVNFTANATNAITYKFVTTSGEQISSSGNASFTFTSLGVNTYQVTVVAFGTGGVSSSTTIEVEVLVTYSPPQDLLDKLVGDGSKTWRIKSEKQGHFGLGPVGGTVPTEWYGAGPEEKAGTGMYDDRYIFNIDGTFTHITDNTNDDPVEDTSGTVFGREVLIEELAGPGGASQQGADILNYAYNDYTENWAIIAPGGVETITLSGKGFMGYYIGGSHQYQIFDRSIANELLIRSTDGNNEFDWWFIITSAEPGDDNNFTSNYNNLIWQDEFDVNGAPDPSNWTYDLGGGGWGNQEVQTYTNDPQNSIVEDGVLKITAINDGGNYTSARIKTQGLFAFTYGRIEARAKVPATGGTWPAVWALGANFDTVGWPDCGEIDVMEHVANDLNTIHGTLHYPGNSGGNGNSGSTTVGTATTEFHTYTVEWSPDEILFVVDDTTIYHTFVNDASTPFNADFFLILNLAMGGNFGGTIDPSFTQETFEVDYIRVYQ